MAVWSSVRFNNLAEDLRIDAEHYRPEYLRQTKAVSILPHKKLIEIARVSDGNHLTIASRFTDAGVRYLRGQDLSDFFISDADPLYIPETDYTALSRSHMKPGDVLIGIVGTIGSVGLVTERHGKLTGSCKLAIVRPHALATEYVAAYLASKPGQNDIQRRIRGAVQMGLILADLKEIPIPIPSDSHNKLIVGLVRASQMQRANATRHYAEAEALLLSSLRLSKLDLSPSLFYVRHYSDATSAGRFDAEYFQPPKRRVLTALSKLPHRLLSDHFRSVRDLFQPERAAPGDLARNFDLTDALQPFLDDNVSPIPARKIGSTKKRFRSGDVVVSRLRSYLKEIAVARTTDAIPCVGSSEFYVMRPKGGALSAETLLVYLRCPLVQTVLKWCQDGSNHPRFDERELLMLPVPTLLSTVQAKIDMLVNQSFAARREAARLLDEAKSTVERLILEN